MQVLELRWPNLPLWTADDPTMHANTHRQTLYMHCPTMIANSVSIITRVYNIGFFCEACNLMDSS